VTEQRNVPFNVNESAAEILKMSPLTHKGSIIVTGADKTLKDGLESQQSQVTLKQASAATATITEENPELIETDIDLDLIDNESLKVLL
jgi:uncharacterized Rossmann fold enzyme